MADIGQEPHVLDQATGGSNIGVLDLMGLTPRSQAEIVKWRIFHNAGMYSNVATTGIRWPGTFIVGKRIVRSIVDRGTNTIAGMVGTFSEKGAAGIMRGGGILGDFFAGAPTNLLRVPSVSKALGGRISQQAGEAASMAIGQAADKASNWQLFRTSKGTDTRLYNVANRAVGGGGNIRGIYGGSSAASNEALRGVAKGAARRVMIARSAGMVTGFMNVYLAFQIGAWAGSSVYNATENAVNHISRMRQMDWGGPNSLISRSRPAYTERQRAIQEIQNSNLNARRFIGNEAALNHM